MPSPAVAAFLSFLFPGLGQVYAGARQRGLLLALPWLALLLAIAAVILGGRLIDLVSHSETMLAVLVFLVAVFFYHVAAILDAYVVASREREYAGAPTPRSGLAVVAALIVVLIVPYGVVEVYGVQANSALDAIARGDNTRDNPFIPGFTDDPTPEPGSSPTTPAPATPGASPSPTSPGSTPAPPTPVPPDFGPIDAAWAENGRLDLLLVGADAGQGRSSVRTDTMILLSVEIQTGKAAMFGFPRNMVNVPFGEPQTAYPGTTFPSNELLNALWRRAAEQPGHFPGSEGVNSDCQFDFACERGWRALSGAIQNMAGVPLDGIIAVDLNGFARLVDAVGGVWINVPAAVVDDNYPTEDGTRIEIDIQPGCQRMDGTLALAYARSRHQDSDYQRMRRQQIVLQAIRRQFDPLSLLPRVPELLNIARDNLFTTIDRDDIPLMAQVAQRVDADRLHQIRFQQPSLRNVTPEAVQRMRTRVRNIFSEPAPEPTPTPARGERCPPR
ncbi:MAG TPA: LCP family protein [Candidatus Limnocylindria bacterium]|nr:LCP family protein [Candidatus Limnocylindria bacterium]